MFLTTESPARDSCDVFLAFFFSNLLMLLMQMPTSDETKKVLSGVFALDGDFSTNFSWIVSFVRHV